MSDPLKIRKVEPIGKRRTVAFVDRRSPDGEGLVGGLEQIELNVYPASPRGEELRDARVAADVSLGEAARAAGIRVSEWSGIETGHGYEPEDWAEAFKAIEKAKRHA